MSNNNTANISSIVSKVWAFCNTLRDDGVGYGEWLHKDQTHFNSAMVQLKDSKEILYIYLVSQDGSRTLLKAISE